MQFSGLTRPASAFCLDNNNAKEQANCKTKQKSNCLAKQQQQCVHKFNNERTKELHISVHTSSFTHRFNETKRKNIKKNVYKTDDDQKILLFFVLQSTCTCKVSMSMQC